MKRKRSRYRSNVQEDLAEMLHHANHHSPIVRIVRAFHGGESLSEKQIATLLNAVTGLKATYFERCLSAWCLGGASVDDPKQDEAADALAKLMTEGHPAGDSLNRGVATAFIISGGCSLLLATGLTIMAGINGSAFWGNGPGINRNFWVTIFALGLFLGGVLITPFSIGYTYAQDTRLRVWAARGLGKVAGVQHIGDLAQSVLSNHAELSGEANEPLVQVLSRVMPADVGKLPLSVSQALCAIAGSQGRRLDLAAIRVIGMVSHGEAIQPMRRLAEKANPVIADAARDALASIEKRLQMERDHGKLLRPSELENTEALLRPASNAQTPAEQLVRPVE